MKKERRCVNLIKSILLYNMLLVLLLCFSVSAEDIDYSFYEELIEQARECLEGEYDPNIQQNEMLGIPFYMFSAKESPIGYCIQDLDENGIDELMFGMGCSIIDLYTISDGTVEHVFSGWNRNTYDLCENGVIANHRSSGAFHFAEDFYTYSEGQLIVVESVSSDVSADGKLLLYHTTDDSEQPDLISEEQLDNIRGKYIHQELNFVPLVDQGIVDSDEITDIEEIDNVKDIGDIEEISDNSIYYEGLLIKNSGISEYGCVKSIDIENSIVTIEGRMQVAKSADKLYEANGKNLMNGPFHFFVDDNTKYISSGEDEPYEISEEDFLFTAHQYNGLGIILQISDGVIIKATVAS